MNFIDNEVTFKDILNPGLISGGPKIAKGKYIKDSNDNITINMPIVNAIDIDWLKAEVPGIDAPITSTGQLLLIIGKIKGIVGNIDSADGKSSILDRITTIENSIKNLPTGEIPDDLAETITNLTSEVSALKTSNTDILTRLTTVENKVNNQGDGSMQQQIIDQVTYLTNKVENIDNIKHVIIEKDRYDSMTSYDPNTLYFIIGEPDYIIVEGGGGGNTPISTKIDLDSITSQLTVNGQLHRESNVVLEPGNTYIISGTLAGTLTIDATQYTSTQMDLIGNTEIILSDVIIVSDETNYGILYKTPVENKGFKDLVVTVNKNTVNIICCRNVQPKADDQWGAIHSMNNLTVRGTGYLSIRNDGGHGIRSTEIEYAGPHMYASVIHDVVHAKKLFWNYGSLYTVKANDVLGTSETGRLIVLGGTFNSSGIEGQLFDCKTQGFYNSNTSITGSTSMNGMVALNAQNFASTMNVNYPGYVYKFANKTDYSAAANGVQVQLTNGVYKVSGNTHPIISINGTISNPIEINTSGGVDATVYLNNAYLTNNTDYPTIYYNPTDKSGKLKIFCMQDSINVIENTYSETSFNTSKDYECDAVKSENNINIEVKNGSHLYVSSKFADGIDGGTMKITDSKGTLVVTHCGQRGLKGNVIVIGPNCEVTESHITEFHQDDTDTDNYTTFDGICVVKDNGTLGEHGPAISSNPKHTGFADMYARNGKASKGEFALKNAELNGIVITGTVGAVVSIDMDNASNMNFNKIITPTVQQSKIVTVSNETTVAYNIYKEAIV